MLNNLTTTQNDVKELNNAPFEFNPKTMIKVNITGWVRYAQFIGTERITRKNGSKGYKEFNHSNSNMAFATKPHSEWTFNDWKSHHIGLLGELAYALETGEQPDMALLTYGDGNEDFKGGVDVKSSWTQNTHSNKLIENCYKKDKNQISKYYVKANIDWNTKEVILVGWCSGEYLVNEGVQHNFGKANPAIGDDGERYVVHYSDLKPMHTLPPFTKAKTIQAQTAMANMVKYAGDSYFGNI